MSVVRTEQTALAVLQASSAANPDAFAFPEPLIAVAFAHLKLVSTRAEFDDDGPSLHYLCVVNMVIKAGEDTSLSQHPSQVKFKKKRIRDGKNNP